MATKKKSKAEPTRMCFVKDDDGHTYLIPVDQREDFEIWMEAGPYWDGYEGPEFDKACIGGSATHYSFIDPKEINE